MSDMVDLNEIRRHVSPASRKEERAKREEERLRQRFLMEKYKSEIMALYGEDVPISDIAAQFGVTANSVQHIVRDQIEKWQRYNLETVDRKKALVLARVDQIERLSMESFFLSMQGRRVDIKETHLEGRSKKGKYKNQYGGTEALKGTNFRKDPTGPLEVDNAIPPLYPDPDSLYSSDMDDTGSQLPLEEPDEFGPEPIDPDDAFDAEFEAALEDAYGEHNYKVKTYERTESYGPGDPRFLGVAQWCNNMRVKIWGLDLPEKEQADPDVILTPQERSQKISGLLQQVQIRLAEKKGLPMPTMIEVDSVTAMKEDNGSVISDGTEQE